MSDIEVVLLGTGVPLPSPDRCGAGYVVSAGGRNVMVDCGWGSARRLFAAAIPPPFIDTICFTHMHSDHITDFPDFAIMRWTGGATVPLTIYGPEGTKESIDGFMAGLRRDIGYRFAHHGDKLSRDGIGYIVHEIPAKQDATTFAHLGDLAIDAFEVDHFPVVPALGFRFRHAGKTVVFSGDTKWCGSLQRASKDADMLVCEAMNVALTEAAIGRMRAAGRENTAGIITDVLDYHIPTSDVAKLAAEAGVKHLVLSHIIPPVPNEGPLADGFAAGMAEIFGGRITMGRDLQRFSI